MRGNGESPAPVFVGESAPAVRLREQVRRMAPHFRTALVLGEPGSGRGDVAEALHRGSPVSAGKLLDVVCVDLGLEQLDEVREGTLLLRGFHTISHEDQSQLLSVLMELERRLKLKEASTRMVCCFEGDPRGLLAAGKLRRGVYDRIGAVEVRVPSLRDRLEDLPALLGGLRVTSDALERMCSYSWPGNLTELLTWREGLSGVDVDVADLPAALLEGQPAKAAIEVRLEAVIRRHVGDVLERCGGNKLRAAELLGISRSTLYRMLDGVVQV